MENIAVLIDLASVRMGEHMLRKLCDDMTHRGAIRYAKLYNYSTRRHTEFNGLIQEYHMDTAPSIQGKKRVRIDIREVVDAVRVASCEDIDTLLIVASELDSSYLIDTLRDMGKHIIVGGTSKGSMSANAHEFYMLDRSREVDVEAMLTALARDERTGEIGDTLEHIAVDDISSVETSKVKGDAGAVFPYSDIDMSDIDRRMAEIDRRILAVLHRTKIRRIDFHHGVHDDTSK